MFADESPDWNLDLITLRAFTDSEKAPANGAERDSQIAQLVHAVDVFQADFGVSFDSTAERITLITGDGTVLDPDTALHAVVSLWCRGDAPTEGGCGVAVPVTASRVVESIAAECGRSVVRTGTSRRALSAASLRDDIGFAGSRRGGFVFPQFLAAYDSMMSFGMVLRMLDRHETTLDEVVAALPPFYLRTRAVPCPFDRKGAVMRTMAALGQTDEAEMVEGVRILTDDGWALVLPHATEAVVYVYAEGADDASADATVARYVAAVEDAIANG